MTPMTRREVCLLGAGCGLASVLPSFAAAQGAAGSVITKRIPRTGERVPAVGLGTAGVFNVGGDRAKRAALAMFPDKELAFDLIYKPRLQRLMRERFRLQ